MIPNFSIDLLKPSDPPLPAPSQERQKLEELAEQLGIDMPSQKNTRFLADECHRAVLHLQRDAEKLYLLRAGVGVLVTFVNPMGNLKPLFG